MGSIDRRIGALEEGYVNQLVAERMRLEVEALLDLLEKHLTRAEFIKVARIVVEDRSEQARQKPDAF
jgi:hypothetical protein